MAHAPVYVIIPKHTKYIVQTVTDLLAPYQEADCPRPCREEYLEFRDEEDYHREHYEQDSREMVRLGENGPLEEFQGNSKFRNPQYGFSNSETVSPYLLPPGYAMVTVALKQLYPTLEAYMGEYKPDPKTGRYGRWWNPYFRYDWWMIGGRCTGILDPAFRSDPANLEACSICKGSGQREDWKEKKQIVCDSCRGKGKRMKDEVTETGHACDIVPIEKLISFSEEKIPFPCAIVTPQKKWIEPPGGVWSLFSPVEEGLLDQWLSRVREVLQQHKDDLVVVVDCHM